MERRLAAIMAADVVGYATLINEDETGTLAALKSHRTSVFNPAVASHRGRLVKLMGDGALVEFPSVVNAVNCAVAIQSALAETDSPIRLRIGINLGDVILDANDIYGDGVNVAARLEALAEPGSICISSIVHESVGNRVTVNFADAGEHQLKGITRPVRVWQWRPGLEELPGKIEETAKPSLAILPFENISGDPEQGYFADGIAEDLITLLSKLRQLTVIARNSSFSYKGRAIKVQEIARDLGVRYLVEGSVRKSGDRVRITAQLIDCRDGSHIWAERYDRDIADIFVVQDDVTREIIDSLSVALAPADFACLNQTRTQNPETYDLFLRARELFYEHTREKTREALELMRQARKADPSFAPAAAYACLVHLVDYINDWAEDSEAALKMADELACEAVRLDPAYPYAHIALGNVRLWQRRHENALAEYAEAISRDPNSAIAFMSMGWALHFAGQSEEGVSMIKRGMELDPNYHPMRLHWLAQAEYQLGNFDQAVALVRERLRRQPHSDVSHALLAATYGQLGKTDAARSVWSELLRINPNFSVERRRQILPYKDQADFDKFPEGLRKAGIEV